MTRVADKLEIPTLMSLPELEKVSGGSQAKEDDAKNASKLAQRRQRPAPNGYSLPVGRPKGVPNKVTQTIREAVELAAQPGACHPNGFAGWLVDRAKGGVEDRKIFAGVVSRVIPLQVEKKSDTTMRIELGWLQGRDVGRHLSQPLPIAAQVIDLEHDSAGVTRIKDQRDADTGGDPAGGVPAQEGAGDAQEG